MRSATIVLALIAVATASPLTAHLESVTPQDVFDHLISTGELKPAEIVEGGKVVGTHFEVADDLFTKTREQLAKNIPAGTTPNVVTLHKRDSYSYECFNSGSWAKQWTLKDAGNWLCDRFNYGSQSGQWQGISTDSHYGNSVGDAMYVKGWARINGGWFANAYECKGAFGRFLDSKQSPCHGASQDSRGGYITQNHPETGHWGTFGIDPTTLNCNC